MLLWKWLKKCPKWVLIVVLGLGAPALFFLWYSTRPDGSETTQPAAPQPVAVEETEPEPPEPEPVEFDPQASVLVGNNLLDIPTGAVLKHDWLDEFDPNTQFPIAYDAQRDRLIARTERGFDIYKTNGLKRGQLALFQGNVPMQVADDLSTVYYGEGGDLWRAAPNWDSLELEGQAQITGGGQFTDRMLAPNILFWSDNAMFVRRQMRLLRIDLQTGEVTPSELPLNDIRERISPDNQIILGTMPDMTAYWYDAEADQAQPLGQGLAINSYRWIDNGTCIVLRGHKEFWRFDRENKELEKLAEYPFTIHHLGPHSPEGKNFLGISGTAARRQMVLLDLESGDFEQVQPMTAPAFLSEDAILYTRDVMTSAERGTWLHVIGESPRRIIEKPLEQVPGTDGVNMLKLPADDSLIIQIATETWQLDPQTLQASLITRDAGRGVLRAFPVLEEL